MKPDKLDKYKKVKNETPPKVSTSVFLEKKQIEFIKKRSLNLSRLIRDFLEKLMRGETDAL